MAANRQNSTHSTDEIRPEQAKLIAALMQGLSVTEASQLTQIDRSTYYLWRKSDANFQAALNRAKLEQKDSFRAQIKDLGPQAMSTIKELLTAPNVPAAVRLKTALSILQSMGALDPEPPGKIDPEQIGTDILLAGLSMFS